MTMALGRSLTLHHFREFNSRTFGTLRTYSNAGLSPPRLTLPRASRKRITATAAILLAASTVAIDAKSKSPRAEQKQSTSKTILLCYPKPTAPSSIRFGTTKQSVNGKRKIRSFRETSAPLLLRQSIAATLKGINKPVFFSQNQTTFSWPWSQPNSQAKNFPALTALLWVDHHICGSATSDATMTKVNQSRQRLCRSAMQAPTPITTTKLCA